MANNKFFSEQKEQSLIKSTIVHKYFWAWAKVMIGNQKRYPQHGNKIAYIDLFAGPGRYKDMTKSTPLLILEKAIEDLEMKNRLVTIFNDKNDDNSKSLENSIKSLPNINNLKNKPSVYNEEIGTEVVKMFENMSLVPSLIFIDPWGYKGLSLRLVNSVLKDWGCECIFFFNYNRINMGLRNPKVYSHMQALFGDRTDNLINKLENISPQEREFEIVEELCNALIDMGGKYVLPFTFKNSKGKRTSHHLIYVSKHVLGYTIMKEIMSKESSTINQGVATFEYNPVDKRQPFLFQFTKPLDELKLELLRLYSGKKINRKQIFEEHHVGTPYIKKNYLTALLELEIDNKIFIFTEKKRRKNTLAEHLNIQFSIWNNENAKN